MTASPADGKTKTKTQTKKASRPPLVGDARKDRGLVDVFMTAPVFVVYHLGVVFLRVRNGFDPITDGLLSVLHRSLAAYLGLTLLVAGLLFAAMKWTRVGGKISAPAFLLRIGESTVYAFGMAAAAKSVVAHTLGVRLAVGMDHVDPFSAVVLSSGAGFYEELAFRVLLFGFGAWIVHRAFKKTSGRVAGELAVAVVAASCFSAVHYVGALGDPFTLGSFVFRLVCGLALTAVYRFRGFAAAVWTHALYDVGVMLF